MFFAIDFDGTLCHHKYPDIGDPIACTINFIYDLKACGHKFILLTMREGEKLQEALDWLKKYDIVPDYVNDNAPELCEEFNNNPRKVFAHGYIDDRNAGSIMSQIQWFRATYNIPGGFKYEKQY